MKKCIQQLDKYGILVLILAAAAASLGSWSCRGGYSTPVESVAIGIMANAGDALIFAADEQRYFTANGLEVTLETYAHGLAATNALLQGKVNLAYSTEFVVVGKALQKEEIGIITVYSKNNTVSLVGRKDRGIRDIQDLRGKKIGLALGTINEFYLGRLLNLNGLGIDDVTLLDVKLEKLGSVLSSGEVDVVVAGSRNLYPLIKQQRDETFVWPAHSDRPAYGTLAGTSTWTKQHPELVKRLLKSLSDAEQDLSSNPDEVKAAVQRRLNFDDEYMTDIWSEYQLALSLDQSLITAMEDEARWMIANHLTTEKQVPDFLDYIYEHALKTVKPEVVNIIR